MARLFRALLILTIAVTLGSCGSKFRTYNGPTVTQVQVHKADRKMYLLHDDQVLQSYDIALGFAPDGPKQVEGDGKTPEGLYYISHRNPRSTYHLSLGVSYPNAADVANAEALGMRPGGDIFIHGGPLHRTTTPDWTAGCIAVKNREIEEIYAMVNPGTPIWILP